MLRARVNGLSSISSSFFKDSATYVYRITGWVFSCNNGVTLFTGVESHAPTTKGPHKVFIDGKLAPNVTALKAIPRSFDAIG